MAVSTVKSRKLQPSLNPWSDESISECGGYVSRAFIVGAVRGALERSAHSSRVNRRSVERDLTRRFESLFQVLAQEARSFHGIFSRAFASKYDYYAIEAIRCRAILGRWDFLPSVSIVSPDVLRGGYGAYGPETQTMYLSEGLALANAGLAVEVMIELMGMHILNLTERQGRLTGGAVAEPTSRIVVGREEVAVDFYVGALCCGLR